MEGGPCHDKWGRRKEKPFSKKKKQPFSFISLKATGGFQLLIHAHTLFPSPIPTTHTLLFSQQGAGGAALRFQTPRVQTSTHPSRSD